MQPQAEAVRRIRQCAHCSQWLSNCRGRLPVTRIAHEDRLRQGFQSSLVPHILESRLLSVGIFLPVPPVKRHFPSQAFTTPSTWFLGHSRSFSLSLFSVCLASVRDPLSSIMRVFARLVRNGDRWSGGEREGRIGLGVHRDRPSLDIAASGILLNPLQSRKFELETERCLHDPVKPKITQLLPDQKYECHYH